MDEEDKVQEFLVILNQMGIEGVLQKGHEAMLRLLVARVSAGAASHQELAILRNLLRDNGMVLGKVLDGKANEPTALPDHEDLLLELPVPNYERR